MPNPTNGGQSALEIAAIAARNAQLPQNTYNNVTSANQYGPTHTRALADSLTPNYGKGTGSFLDIDNYNAGSAIDIFGNQGTAVGSGRNPALADNLGRWGHAPGHNYQHPNTAGNIGQVII